jgi:hypothetical protein
MPSTKVLLSPRTRALLMATEPFHIFAISSDQIAATRDVYEREALQHAQRHLAAAEQKAKALGVSCDTLVVENAHPYEAIIATERAAI